MDDYRQAYCYASRRRTPSPSATLQFSLNLPASSADRSKSSSYDNDSGEPSSSRAGPSLPILPPLSRTLGGYGQPVWSPASAFDDALVAGSFGSGPVRTRGSFSRENEMPGRMRKGSLSERFGNLTLPALSPSTPLRTDLHTSTMPALKYAVHRPHAPSSQSLITLPDLQSAPSASSSDVRARVTA